METKFNFTLTKPQVVEVFKKQSRKVSKILLIMSIAILCLTVLIASLYFFVENDDIIMDAVKIFAVVDLFSWLVFIFVRCTAPKNAETYFKYNSVNDVVEYSYEITETDFVVSQPALGNVVHFKYDAVLKVVDLGGYVAVTLATNQFLPIPATEHTAPLIATLKSLAQVKK